MFNRTGFHTVRNVDTGTHPDYRLTLANSNTRSYAYARSRAGTYRNRP